ncbi:Cephalosporin-C deacetylase [Gemmata sp. SH-PL17]|uniref:alpha/beta hydrolase family protein n=1 Tax=Gemmata sp. SH-PL17 TaxID=1630693 RepID=UPI0004BC8E23|nr:alpha/beta fold hydrolase [Gemmata sp. SH-PL17]AMV30232.1 Cephalosporin-C deacetylase [Gemmata sp. SH-PL17]
MSRLSFALLFALIPTSFCVAEEPDRVALRKKMERAMGPFPSADRKVPLDPKVVSEEKLDGYVRLKITFAVEKGDRVPAWLLVPNTATRDKKAPAMLCLHQTIAIGKDEPIGLGKQDSKAQALHLVKRGFVCLAPDYPSFGEYKYDFQAAFKRGDYQSGTMKAIWNNMRAVDYLQSLPEVDGERIGVIGHSLGGHNSMFTAAFDERLKVIVSSCGFCSFAKYYKGNLKGWTSERYMPVIAREFGNDPKKMPFDFSDVVTSFAPRAFLAVAPEKDDNFEVSGVRDVIVAAEPAYKALKATDKLKALYPDAGHDFPADARKTAYEFIEAELKK